MKRNKGFTLIELLVVVAIIGVLASIILSSLNSARAKARDARRESDIKTIQTALEMYYLDHGYYPKTGWRFSYNANWQTFLGITLPVDPINQIGSGPPYNGHAFDYAYFAHPNSSYCNGQAYILVYNKETSNGTGPNDGVTLCNNTSYTYGNAFVTGMDKDGNLRFN